MFYCNDCAIEYKYPVTFAKSIGNCEMCEKYGQNNDCPSSDLPRPELPSMLEAIIEQFDDQEFLKADGFDDAVIGFSATESRLVYSVSMCVDILMEDHNMDFDEALEYFEFNVSGAYVGEQTPIWCHDFLSE
jgi:hypothetical protein